MCCCTLQLGGREEQRFVLHGGPEYAQMYCACLMYEQISAPIHNRDPKDPAKGTGGIFSMLHSSLHLMRYRDPIKTSRIPTALIRTTADQLQPVADECKLAHRWLSVWGGSDFLYIRLLGMQYKATVFTLLVRH